MYTLEIGDGWARSLLETEQEYEFVKVAQRGLADDRSYWIGGSTVETVGTLFPFLHTNILMKVTERHTKCTYK